MTKFHFRNRVIFCTYTMDHIAIWIKKRWIEAENFGLFKSPFGPALICRSMTLKLLPPFRNLCDMNQEGKLNPEQFALAMWLIARKQAGKDPPAALTPDMIPPSMRPKAKEGVNPIQFRHWKPNPKTKNTVLFHLSRPWLVYTTIRS